LVVVLRLPLVLERRDELPVHVVDGAVRGERDHRRLRAGARLAAAAGGGGAPARRCDQREAREPRDETLPHPSSPLQRKKAADLPELSGNPRPPGVWSARRGDAIILL